MEYLDTHALSCFSNVKLGMEEDIVLSYTGGRLTPMKFGSGLERYHWSVIRKNSRSAMTFVSSFSTSTCVVSWPRWIVALLIRACGVCSWSGAMCAAMLPCVCVCVCVCACGEREGFNEGSIKPASNNERGVTNQKHRSVVHLCTYLHIKLSN